MGGEGLVSATRFLVVALGVLFLLGAALMRAGRLGFPSSGRPALPVPNAVATVIACSVALARRSAPD